MKGNSWGNCPYRYFGWIEEKGLYGGLGYICGKRNVACDSDYCLGPDEDHGTEKGDENERKAV